MSKTLCTFTGPNGDILWSLPTACAISLMVGEPVDFAVMPYYDSLLPLIEYQPYIEKAFAVKDWIRLHSNYGDQPWHTPKYVEEPYKNVYHLTYRAHPGFGGKRLPLIDFTAYQQGIQLIEPIPFLKVPHVDSDVPVVAYGFNPQYPDLKNAFKERVMSELSGEGLKFVDTTTIPWLEAASIIKTALCFVCCRSSNYVIAHGVGQQNIFVYEPHPSRNAAGHLGEIFGCPYSYEITAPWLAPPEVAADMCVRQIKDWKQLLVKERDVINA